MSTAQQPPSGEEPSSAPAPSDRAAARRTLVWLSLAGASAAITFLTVRALLRKAPVDPTSERIQALIDEANRLLRTLDERQHD